jgi:hypothetical protein
VAHRADQHTVLAVAVVMWAVPIMPHQTCGTAVGVADVQPVHALCRRPDELAPGTTITAPTLSAPLPALPTKAHCIARARCYAAAALDLVLSQGGVHASWMWLQRQHSRGLRTQAA